MTPRFKANEAVLDRSTKEPGRVVGDAELDQGEFWYRVRFTRREKEFAEDDLEPAGDAEETIESVAARAAWGTVRAFRTALAVERITNANQSTVYVFQSQRVLFQAFQYKPLLKILASPDRRLLIADEVGLGKTIETGLILAELEARQPLDRVLVACPSRLREKWRDEMSRKFGLEFDIAGRKELDDYLMKVRRTARRLPFRFVVSTQTLRQEELRQRFLAEVDPIDLLVVDEAHHARNRATQTSESLRVLCAAAQAVVLLTATPLHLGNRDLFTLLQALRPSEFRDPRVFDDLLSRFQPVHEAALLVRSQKETDLASARRLLKGVFEVGVPAATSDPLAGQVIQDMNGTGPRDRRAWLDLERRVQDLHPLSAVLTRTRKRDVYESAAIRDPKVYLCRWTPEEEAAYAELVHGASGLGWIDLPLTLAQIQKARQAASCLPAALRTAHEAALADDEAVEMTDIPPSDLPPTLPPDHPAPDRRRSGLKGRDSKLAKLLEVLRLVEDEEPGAKVLIFTFFVGTSRYLEERLTEEGFLALRIAGDVPSDPKRPDRDDRGATMRRFRDDPRARVLVSTEVGSEGLDFQFCHYLVNYDLPWNPMVVEQRIGRIDRFGQKALKLKILNLVVEGTVEERVLYQLYQRIGLFERSVGPLEAILGEEVHKLQQDYVSGKLTSAEAEARVEQAARAIEEGRARQEELERNAGHLFGHEEYLKDQLKRVGRLGRYVSEQAILAVIETFMTTRHPAIRIWQEPAGVYHLHLTDALRLDLQSAAGPLEPWIERGRTGQLSFCFAGEMAFDRPDLDLVNVAHPLLKAAVAAVRRSSDHVHARVAKGVLALGPAEDADLEAGDYFVVVFSHAVGGIRARRVLETVVWSVARQAVLAAEVGERLMHLVQERGTEWESARPAPELAPELFARLKSEARARNRELHEAERRENEALFVRQKGLREAEFEYVRQTRSAALATAERNGRTRVIPALKQQLLNAEARFRDTLARLEQTRTVTCSLSDPIAACLVAVARATPLTKG